MLSDRPVTVEYVHPGFRDYRKPLLSGLGDAYGFRYHSLDPLSEDDRASIPDSVMVREYDRDADFVGTFGSLFSTLRDSDADVVLTSISDSPQSVVAALACRLGGPDLVLWSEEWQPRVTNAPGAVGVRGFLLQRPRVSRFVADTASSVLLPHEKWYDYWESLGVDEANVFYTSQCSLDYADRPHESLRDRFDLTDEVVVLYLGRIVERKGLDVLVRACADLDDTENIFLLVGGDGPFRAACERLAAELSLSNVRFAGRVPDEEVASYYHTADVFVLPSCLRDYYEPYGLTINEAMSRETPVVTTDAVGAAGWMVRDGETGYVAPEGNVAALRDALSRLVENPDEREAMGRRARELFEEYNDYDRMVDGFRRGIDHAADAN